VNVAFEFKLPDVGEGLTEAEILKWSVAVGDKVEINDMLVEIETAKSAVELPSPVAGTIGELRVAEGEIVAVGTVIVTVVTVVTAEEAVVSAAAEPSEPAPAVLVGPGPSAPAQRRRHLGPRSGPTVAHDRPAGVPEPVTAAAAVGTAVRALAKPPVRMLARELGVDLNELGAHLGRIVTREDVTEAAGQRGVVHSDAPATRHEVRIPIRGVRKATAAAMAASAFTAPHVTEWLAVDMTATMDLLARLKADPRFEGVRLNPLLLVAKAVLLAVRANPGINASWDEGNQEIVQYGQVNLGIATATPRGLIVPNIKDADTLDLVSLAGTLSDLVATARAGKTSPSDMSRGTITITNIGALGVDAGTPILNPGEAAIVAFGQIRDTPWIVDGQVVARKVAQLAMSFDHRLVDGELGSKALVDIGRVLHDPAQAVLYA
jgi:2-oxoisovalerate dehydrogenase E2 component (dihydrolipoyl transacylase)